jgi:hypothetical protein
MQYVKSQVDQKKQAIVQKKDAAVSALLPRLHEVPR